MNREDLLRGYPALRERLLATLSRLVGPNDAEDLANDTLLRALAAIDDFRGEAALSTWLHRIAINLAYDLLRKRNHGVGGMPPRCGAAIGGILLILIQLLPVNRCRSMP